VPGPLVDPTWLADHLDEVRVIEATAYLDPPIEQGKPYHPRAGRAEYEAGHIPGAAFADLVDGLAEPDDELNFTFPSPERFAAGMSALGVEDGTSVVVYDRNGMMWATRLWWLLRAYGFDDAAVLDGGLDAWVAEGRPVTTEPPAPREARFTARPRPDVMASLDEVAGGPACLLNALSPAVFRGEENRYGRAGRIPGSVNVYAHSIVDPETHRLLPLPDLRERFDAVGALDGERVVAYCGGGISATLDAFALTLLGARDVAVYDGSMAEWIADPARPLDHG
jgi:thiosulfate/3-mercaptopyruvate sulfurtransferase